MLPEVSQAILFNNPRSIDVAGTFSLSPLPPPATVEMIWLLTLVGISSTNKIIRNQFLILTNIHRTIPCTTVSVVKRLAWNCSPKDRHIWNYNIISVKRTRKHRTYITPKYPRPVMAGIIAAASQYGRAVAGYSVLTSAAYKPKGAAYYVQLPRHNGRMAVAYLVVIIPPHKARLERVLLRLSVTLGPSRQAPPPLVLSPPACFPPQAPACGRYTVPPSG